MTAGIERAVRQARVHEVGVVVAPDDM